MSILAGRYVETKIGRCRGILGGDASGDFISPAAAVFGGVTLSLTFLALAGIDRHGAELWLPYCSVKVASKFCGAWREADGQLLAAVVLDAELILETRFTVPRSSGSCGVKVSLAGKSFASVTAIGNCKVEELPAAEDRQRLRAHAASFGTSSRNDSATLELVAGIAAATGCPPPSSVAVQPVARRKPTVPGALAPMS